MKQTNNAIKFLMAQYRAIFKNANIAMVAAMAVSALAAGQAQAAAGNWANINKGTGDSISAATEFTSDQESVANSNTFTLTIDADGQVVSFLLWSHS